MRRLFPLIPLALAVLAVWQYSDDRSSRQPVKSAASRFTFDIRRPMETEMMAYAPSADFAAQVFASGAVGDALGSKRLTNLSSPERRAWLDVPLYLDEELAAAIDLQLAAMHRNPGWPLHRYFLGKLAYTRDRRSLGGEVEPLKWLVPLASAYRSAPNHRFAAETLAGVLLEAWNLLPAAERDLAPEVLQSAFIEPQFVRLAFDVAVDVVGEDAAFRTLPADPPPLSAAVAVLGRRGEIDGAAELYARWEAAEWRAREADLEAMRMRMARGDWKGLLAASARWGSIHGARDFDNPAALRQLEEVLKLWPKDQVGSWSTDRRGEMVRFFLDGRLDSIDPAVLESTVSALSNVPLPIRARVALAAGNVGKAEAFVRAAGSEGSFEWTDYFVDLARQAVDRADLDGAIDAISRISPSARRECEVLVVRREAGEEIEPPQVAVTDDSGVILNEAWSRNGMLGFCVDPMSSRTGTLVVNLETIGPALLEWGLNTGRRGTILLNGREQISMPLRGLTGRNVLFTRTLWGESIVNRTARVD